jgi:hypothetical protein
VPFDFGPLVELRLVELPGWLVPEGVRQQLDDAVCLLLHPWLLEHERFDLGGQVGWDGRVVRPSLPSAVVQGREPSLSDHIKPERGAFGEHREDASGVSGPVWLGRVGADGDKDPI